jgi:predicted AlkP superfamily phosphohydrolase/phosphomutase
MHFLWRYTDPGDPTYPGPNRFENSIKDSFRMFDAIVGKFMEHLSPGQSLLIVSDHGHSMRPIKALHVNEMLRKGGLLTVRKGQVPGLNAVALIEKTKSAFLQLMHKLDLEDQVYRIASLIPKEKRRQLKTSSYAVERESSTAWVSEVGGGTSFGGIEINRSLVGPAGKDYEALRDRLITMLGEAVDSAGSPIADWVKRREEVFSGGNVEKYPDVIFELHGDYGVDRTLFCGTVGRSSTHKKVSGGHSKFGALMLYNGPLPDALAGTGQVHISSVFSLIQQTLGIS